MANALNQLDAAQQRVDVSLVDAMKLRVPANELRELLGISHATFWRRVKAAREATQEAPATGSASGRTTLKEVSHEQQHGA